MIDIYRELTEISIAEFGWQVRDPIRRALQKLSIGQSLDQAPFNALANTHNSGKTGNNFVKAFVDLCLQLRTAIRRTEEIDNNLINVINNFYDYSDGPMFRRQFYETLLGFMNCVNNPQEESTYRSVIFSSIPGICRIIAGNEEQMFMKYQHEEDTERGIEIKYPSSASDTITVITVTNVVDGSSVSQEVRPTDDTTWYNPFNNNQIYYNVYAGILKIEVTYKDTGLPVDGCDIRFDVCKFGDETPEEPGTVTAFVLDVSRYSSDDKKLYSSNNREVGEMKIISGTDAVEASSHGLDFKNNAWAEFNVNLPTDESWTMTIRMKDVAINPGGVAHLVHTYGDNALSFVFGNNYQNPNLTHRNIWQYMGWRFSNNDGDGYETPYYDVIDPHQWYFDNGGSVYKSFDATLMTREASQYCMDVVLTCDTNYVTFYCNGINKGKLEVSRFEPIKRIGINHPDVPVQMTLLYFSITKTVDPPQTILYKYSIDSNWGDGYISIARLYLYSQISQGVGTGEFGRRWQNSASCHRQSVPSREASCDDTYGRPDVRSICASMLGRYSCGSNGAKNAIYGNGVVFAYPIDIIISVPVWNYYGEPDTSDVDLTAVAYQYAAPTENFSGRLPRNFSLSKSVDNGATWTTLDTRTDIPAASVGADSQLFVIS